MTPDTQHSTSTVTVANGRVDIRHLVVDDPDVAACIHGAADPGAAVTVLLRLGARVSASVEASAAAVISERQIADVGRAVSTAVGTISTTLDQTSDRVTADLEAVVDERVAPLLRRFAGYVRDQLDPAAADKLVAAIQQQLTAAATEATRSHLSTVTAALDRELDFGRPGSPLHRIDSSMQQLRTDLTDLRQQITAEEARKAARTQTHDKGYDLEQLTVAEMGRLTGGGPDVIEATGKEVGEDGTFKGDALWSWPGRRHEHRIAVECKTARVSARVIAESLRQAMSNYKADAGLWVVDSPDLVPGRQGFDLLDEDLVVVALERGEEPAALRLAMRYLRVTVEARAARNRHGEDPTAALQTVASHLRHARTAMKEVSVIRRDHSRAIRAIELAGRHVTSLQESVLEQLTLAERALEGDDAGDAGTAEAA